MNLWIRSQDKKKLLSCTHIQIKEQYDETVHNRANKAYESVMSCLRSGGVSRDYDAVKRNAEKEKQRVYDSCKTVFLIRVNEDILGSYNSETRALEILNEIQTILNPPTVITLNNIPSIECNELKDNNIGIQTINMNNSEIKPLGISSVVYEMPKE